MQASSTNCATDAATQRNADWLVCPDTVRRLAQLEGELLTFTSHTSSWMTAVNTHLIRERGKHLRGTLVLLSASEGSADPALLIRCAAAVELLHLSTLVHDDVIDQSDTRRGCRAVHQEFGNSVAALSGIFLFCRASSAIMACDDARIRELYAETVMDCCTGQLNEVNALHNPATTIDAYHTTIRRKTASLFEFACALGSLLAGAPATHTTALRGFGDAFGRFFQLADDLLDIVGDATILGKQPGNDMKKGVYTLPVLAALQAEGSDATEFRKLLRTRLEGPTLEHAVRLLRQGSGWTHGLAETRRAAATARESLESLPPSLPRRSMENLVDSRLAVVEQATAKFADAEDSLCA